MTDTLACMSAASAPCCRIAENTDSTPRSAINLATVMAGNDLPDLMYLYVRTGSPSTQAAAAEIPQFLQSQAANLTLYLAGDAAKDYPNLAAIPTQAWKNAGCVCQGRLYMVPIRRYLAGQMFIKHVDDWDSALGNDCIPKSADDFKRALLALTKPQQGFYGIVAAQGSGMYIGTQSSTTWRESTPSGCLNTMPPAGRRGANPRTRSWRLARCTSPTSPSVGLSSGANAARWSTHS